jgi:pyruvate/2-oxoglutarate dehydrogenase complex dihydrolipoamide acyltransferase (E2) component
MRTLGRIASGKLRPRPETQAHVWILAGVAALAVGTAAGGMFLPGQPQASAAPAAAQAAPANPPGPAPASRISPAPAASGAVQQDQGQQLARQTAELLTLATELKNDIYTAHRETLSVAAVRKADEIQKLAHTLRSKR